MGNILKILKKFTNVDNIELIDCSKNNLVIIPLHTNAIPKEDQINEAYITNIRPTDPALIVDLVPVIY